MKQRAQSPGTRALLSLLAALGILAVAAPARADLWRKQPYLIFPGVVDQMEVLWQLTATSSPTIEWGTDTTCSLGSAATVEYGTDHQHAFTIGGLAPATRYYYRVTADGVAHGGSFTSAPAADATRLKFFAYGDTRTYPTTHDQVCGAMISAFTADPEYQTFTLFVGDFVTSGSSESYWTSEQFNPIYGNIRQLMADLPVEACVGNHESSGTLFAKYFPYPFAGGRYWSFDYGPAHFMVLDQYIDYTPGTPQYDWLVSDIESSRKPWKIVLLHEPGWSAGGGHPNNVTVQTYLEPLFEIYAIPIVFGGHNHYYARAVVRGVQHITTGGGGAPPYTPDTSYPNVVAGVPAYHFCQVEIDGGTLAFKAVNLAGAVIDSFSTTHAVPVEGAPVREGVVGAARPNPTTGETAIECRLGAGQEGRLVVRDVGGRVVRVLGPLSAGPHLVRWDGRDMAGRPAQTGLYFYRLEWATGSAGGKLLLLR